MKNILIILFVVIGTTLFAQQQMWVKTTSDEPEQCRLLTSSADGQHIYYLSIVGRFANFILAIRKFDVQGNLVWEKKSTKVGPKDDIMNLTAAVVSDDGSLYFTGYDQSVQSFNGNTVSGSYLVKFSSAGDFLWTKRVETFDNISTSKLAVDRFGSVYWEFICRRSFTLENVSTGEPEVLQLALAKFNSTGNLEYCKTSSPVGDVVITMGSLTIKDDQLYLCGAYNKSGNGSFLGLQIGLTGNLTGTYLIRASLDGQGLSCRNLAMEFADGVDVRIIPEGNEYFFSINSSEVPNIPNFPLVDPRPLNGLDLYVGRLDADLNFLSVNLYDTDNDLQAKITSLASRGAYKIMSVVNNSGASGCTLNPRKSLLVGMNGNESCVFVDSLISKGQVYHLQILPVGEAGLMVAGSVGMSDDATFKNGSVVPVQNTFLAYYNLNIGVGELNKSNTQVYPNPAGQFWMIEIPESNIRGANLEIYDSTGKMIYSSVLFEKLNKLELDGLQRGAYTIKVVSSGFTESFKLLRE